VDIYLDVWTKISI